VKVEVLTAFLGIVTAFIIFFLVRRDLLHLKHSIFWILIALVVLFFGLFPNINIKLAHLLGIQYAPILPVLLAILILFVKTLVQDIELSDKEKKLRRLAQELAILKKSLFQKPEDETLNSKR